MSLREDERVRDVMQTDGALAAAYFAFDLWAERWREDHPDDERTDYELACEEYWEDAQ